MSSCPLYTGLNNMHHSLMGKMRLLLIDSELLHEVHFWRFVCISTKVKYGN